MKTRNFYFYKFFSALLYFTILGLFIFCQSCAYYPVAKESLVAQIKESQTNLKNESYPPSNINTTAIAIPYSSVSNSATTYTTLYGFLMIAAINELFQEFGINGYPSNHLSKIKCQDKKGNLIWLQPDKNTEFIFLTKSGKKKAYYDTVLFRNDTLIGLRSRIVGGQIIIPVSQINKINIYAELPITIPAKDSTVVK